MRIVLAVCLATPVLLGVTSCVRDTAPPADTSAHGAATTKAPPPRTALLGGLGPYHREIQTTNAEAQRFFDEGLNLLYGFNHEEAFASFGRAATLDPTSPMPHWGMALALGTNINDPAPADRLKKAYAHLADAVKLSANGSQVEQGLVAALGKRYIAQADSNQPVREKAYSDAMGALFTTVSRRRGCRRVVRRKHDEPASVEVVHGGRFA